jgi:hypothetical protein
MSLTVLELEIEIGIDWLTLILKFDSKLVLVLASCSEGFRFVAQYISILEFSPASDESNYITVWQKWDTLPCVAKVGQLI